MLAITRKVGESIAIGDHIVVKVLEVQGQKVQLGIEAPRELRIARPEPRGGANQPPQRPK